jgi:hypothetical protein
MRTMTITTVAALAVCGPAAAAVSYEHGLYKSGSAKGTGARITFEQGAFEVQRIGFQDHCDSPAGDGFDGPVAFEKSSDATTGGARLHGKVKANGHFKGRYVGQGAVFKVSGRVKGGKASLTAEEHGSYTKHDTEYQCEGTHDFTVRHKG